MIGEDYLKKLTMKIRQAATIYEFVTWGRMLNCIREEELNPKHVSVSGLRERIKAFNGMLEKVHRTQAMWLVTDSKLRTELRICILQKLVPTYNSFVKRYGSNVKYSVMDLCKFVLELFQGSPASPELQEISTMGRRKFWCLVPLSNSSSHRAAQDLRNTLQTPAFVDMVVYLEWAVHKVSSENSLLF
ncbi:hypothetical protein RJT34_17045 [Clitoria ternatea]|uniref:Exocyst subunit Exo70 family protein n=1 Tax=Clitoria ternatea TaxID=43366 RepID=A0AAN9J879_CLITE